MIYYAQKAGCSIVNLSFGKRPNHDEANMSSEETRKMAMHTTELKVTKVT